MNVAAAAAACASDVAYHNLVVARIVDVDAEGEARDMQAARLDQSIELPTSQHNGSLVIRSRAGLNPWLRR
jgi:hypothetical protein